MSSTNIASAEAQMLIRKPVSTVYQALTDSAITTKFWFTKSSGKLEEGKSVTWEWEMYGVSASVMVREMVQDRKISISWGDPATIVDFEFMAVSDHSCYLKIRNYGFTETGDALLSVIKDSTGGFTLLIAGLKAYLEHGIQLNLVGDKFPEEVRKLEL
ncbi:SRPBCC family protein [Zeaxanthinibacter sp. PT1]|uniref:SRPBCC family protein n=1 Tax=Zeaxanthinibacter TaxID=561554 RepID=UPI00234A6AB6|nr:SRPBCC family protein [Zeaxanthinibacter sp. PT1]MDC6350955.1 SRPBCC family protein [Zeaxanthinibacter sp. PT1]